MYTQPEEIRKESILKKNWDFSFNKIKNFQGGILITGANSFIGCHIIRRLQDEYDGNIHLLLRAPSIEGAIQKMQQAFYQWELDGFEPGRFIIHTGDCCSSMMGLQKSEFDQLKKDTGQVIHLAMTPMYHLPYHHFQRIWVPELERMILFCGDPKYPKFLHYASSFNANFFQSDEDFLALNTTAWQSGYAGFKWVASHTIRNAMNHDLEACIYDLPLVVGSEQQGICPSHYSIWLILDIFLKTGYYFPFTFQVIPVNIFAEVLVHNIFQVKINSPSHFIRPMLTEPVTDRLFERTATNLLGLRKADLSVVRRVYNNKLRFDFMMPENFYELLEKVNNLPAIFPDRYDTDRLPLTSLVFISNLNKIMSGKTEIVKV